MVALKSEPWIMLVNTFLNPQAGGWGKAPRRGYCLREVPAVQQARPRPSSRKVRGHARGGRSAALPEHAQLHERGFGEGNKPGLNQHLLDRAVELLDDLLHHVELLRRAAGDHHVALIVNIILGPGKRFVITRSSAGINDWKKFTPGWQEKVVAWLNEKLAE